MLFSLECNLLYPRIISWAVNFIVSLFWRRLDDKCNQRIKNYFADESSDASSLFFTVAWEQGALNCHANGSSYPYYLISLGC